MTDIKRMRVVDLRCELDKHNFDHKKLRLKAQLVDALNDILSSNNNTSNNDNNNNNNNTNTKTKKAKVSKKRKVTDTFKKAVKPVTEVIKSGSNIPVDKLCPLADKVHVYKDWDATLNQTNATRNNNKYYLLQVLKSDNKDEYYAWFRWGRVGYNGQNSLTGPTSLMSAQSAFKSKFRQKTKNSWDNRDNFETYSGKYTLIERDYTSHAVDADKKDNENNDKNKKIKLEIPDTKLTEKVQNFVSMIFDVNMMKKRMIELNYDAEKMPLGKLGKKTITEAYKVLKKLSNVINPQDKNKKNRKVVLQRDAMENLSNQFYTLIPHEFGFRRPPIIDNMQLLKTKLEMLEALQDIEVATKIIDNQHEDKNPIDEYYESLDCNIEEINKKSKEYKLISQYLNNTHGKTHSSYQLDLLDVYRVNRAHEEKGFELHANNPNRRLLFHGSGLSNFVGILSQGLRIAPPEAPATGYMFGKGVYFADSCSKSANYCRASYDNPEGIMLLCEVALGNMNEKFQADYYASDLPPGKESVWGIGRTQPNPKQMITLDDGVIVPKGKMIDSDRRDQCHLQYNEFIVYDTNRIKIRYALKCRFNYNY